MSHSEYYVSAAELRRELGTSDLRVLDVRWSLNDPDGGAAAYTVGHIPGAVYLHWFNDLSDPDDPVEGQLAPPSIFERSMARAGVSAGDRVVAYDDGSIFLASRLAWALRHYGHDRVRVLDGGWPAWLASGGATEVTLPEIHLGDFRVRPAESLRATKAEVEALVQSGGTVIVDCRMDETYQAAGAHIPGALRLPSPDLMDPRTGCLLSDDGLSERLASSGINLEQPLLLYCGGGVSAAAVHTALRSLDIMNARVFDGSWAEWSVDPETPKQSHGRVC